MTTTRIIVNTIFYILLTSFFIFLWIKEKKVVEVIKGYRERFSTRVIRCFRVESPKKQLGVRRTIGFLEAATSALVLVLIIQKFYIGNFMVPTGSMIPTIIPKDRLFGNMVIYNFREPKREEVVIFKEPVENKVLYTKRLMGLPGEEIEIVDQRLIVDGKKVSDRYYTTGALNGSKLGHGKWRIPKKGDTLEIVPAEDYTEEYRAKNIDVEKVQTYLFQHPGAMESILPKLEFIVNGKETGPILDYIHDEEVLKKLIKGEKVEVKLKENYFLVLGDNTEHSYDSRFWGFVGEERIKGKGVVRFWPLNRIGLLK